MRVGSVTNADLRVIGTRNDLEPCLTDNVFDVLSQIAKKEHNKDMSSLKGSLRLLDIVDCVGSYTAKIMGSECSGTPLMVEWLTTIEWSQW